MFNRPKLLATACLCIGLSVSFSGCATLKKMTQGGAPPVVDQTPPQPALAEFSTKKTRQLRIDTANRLAEAGYSKEAAALYLKAEQAEAGKPKFDRQLAPLLAELGRPEEALKRYRNAIQESPTDNDLRVNYAWTLIDSRQFGQAAAELQSIITADPLHSGAMNALAVCNFHQGNADAAYEQFKKLHGAAAARHNMALLCIENEETDAAKRWVEEAMRNNPLPQTEKLASLLLEAGNNVPSKVR